MPPHRADRSRRRDHGSAFDREAGRTGGHSVERDRRFFLHRLGPQRRPLELCRQRLQYAEHRSVLTHRRPNDLHALMHRQRRLDPHTHRDGQHRAIVPRTVAA